MIKELSDLGQRLREEQRKQNKFVHNAIKDEFMAIDLLIHEDGSFDSFLIYPRMSTQAEAITAKKGKARLLLDKAEEVLCYKDNDYIAELSNKGKSERKIEQYIKGVNSKHTLFIEKLSEYKQLKLLSPVFLFYYENRINGIDHAISVFPNQVDVKHRSENIAFRLVGSTERLHEYSEVRDAIIEKFEKAQEHKLQFASKKCSVCGTSKFSVSDEPHGTIHRIPGGLPAGNTLVSYNENAFESYGLAGNENSSICINCARTYVEGLKWLLNNGQEKTIKSKSGKEKVVFNFSNRRNFGSDTAMVFWTKQGTQLDELELLETPDAGKIGLLIDSVVNAKAAVVKAVQPDMFYSCTLSGASARIAVRDWIEISLSEYQKNIGKWFQDIAIECYGETYYSPLYWLAKAGQNDKSDEDTALSRIATHLWDAALKQSRPPLWILSTVLKRLLYIEPVEEGKDKKDPMTKERAALIRLILNRNRKEGGLIIMNESLDVGNLSSAYVCGQIFAVLVDIQRAALGNNVNAGIRERYFSFASTTPASAFGRLMKMSQNHLTKIKNERPEVFFVLDHQLQELNAKIVGNSFPLILSLEEQGQFALGYYHKKQETWKRIQENKALREALENNEEGMK
jgi:CRISPR-associated protein Csd1